MSADLKSLLIAVHRVDRPVVEATGKRLYKQLYLTDGVRGIIKTHDGLDVHFHLDSYEYAFYTRSQWEISNLKDIIDKGRVERVRWIKEFIAGNVTNSRCWTIPVGKAGAKKRLYFSIAPGYVVWLNPRSDQISWSFKTAYPGDPPRIWEYTREVRGSKQIAQF
jgi:hypothetical protein